MSFSRKFIIDFSVHFGKKSVIFIAKEGDKIENHVSFSVHHPLYRDFFHPWESAVYPPHLASWCKESSMGFIMLQSSLHKNDEKSSNHFALLTKRIKAGEIAWGTSNNLTGDSSCTEGYWKWFEDILGRSKQKLYKAEIYRAVYASLFSYDSNPKVLRAFSERWGPLTNTLHTASSELSISLWDLCPLGSLPSIKVVPSIKEHLDCNEKNEYHLPRSCQFFFRAFAVLCCKEGGQQVFISSWVRFWYKRPSRHRAPCANVYRKDATYPKEMRNPCGIIDVPFIRTYLDEEPFTKLDVPDNIKNTVYRADLLSCLICKFVLPTQGGSFIRPSLFQAASLMAMGNESPLAILVLANIYRGLRDILTSSSIKNYTTYRHVHYIYSWLGNYLNIHYYQNHAQNDLCWREDREIYLLGRCIIIVRSGRSNVNIFPLIV